MYPFISVSSAHAFTFPNIFLTFLSKTSVFLYLIPIYLSIMSKSSWSSSSITNPLQEKVFFQQPSTLPVMSVYSILLWLTFSFPLSTCFSICPDFYSFWVVTLATLVAHLQSVLTMIRPAWVNFLFFIIGGICTTFVHFQIHNAGFQSQASRIRECAKAELLPVIRTRNGLGQAIQLYRSHTSLSVCQKLDFLLPTNPT